MVFEGIRGKNYQGDIAIDDISFTNGGCKTATIKPSSGKASYPRLTMIHQTCNEINSNLFHECYYILQ